MPLSDASALPVSPAKLLGAPGAPGWALADFPIGFGERHENQHILEKTPRFPMVFSTKQSIGLVFNDPNYRKNVKDDGSGQHIMILVVSDCCSKLCHHV